MKVKKIKIGNTEGVVFNIVPNQTGAILDVLMKNLNVYSFRTRDNASFLPNPRDISTVRQGVVVCNRYGFMVTKDPLDFVDENHEFFMDDYEMILSKEEKRLIASSFNRSPISLLNLDEILNTIKG